MSLILQSGALITFYTISRYTLDPVLPISTIATIFPIGFFTVALPIAPGGLESGMSHFKSFFSYQDRQVERIHLISTRLHSCFLIYLGAFHTLK